MDQGGRPDNPDAAQESDHPQRSDSHHPRRTQHLEPPHQVPRVLVPEFETWIGGAKIQREYNSENCPKIVSKIRMSSFQPLLLHIESSGQHIFQPSGIFDNQEFKEKSTLVNYVSPLCQGSTGVR